MSEAARVLLMLVAANSGAWLAGRFPFAGELAPLDCGLMAWDGRRLLGSHKSWRGLIGGIVASCLTGGLSGAGWWLAAGFGALSLSGDALSSAAKRRLGRRPGADVPLLDQLPEALLPILLLWSRLAITWLEAAGAIAAFVALDLLCTRRRLGARSRLLRRSP